MNRPDCIVIVGRSSTKPEITCGKPIGHEAAMAMAVKGDPAVPIEVRAAELRRIAEEERADLEAWFADDGTPAAVHQTDASQ